MKSHRSRGAYRSAPTAVPFLALVALAALPMAQHARAQSPALGAPALGMGGVPYDALACGPDALAGNPAMLARRCAAPARLLIMPSVGFEVAGNGAGSEIWRYRSDLLVTSEGRVVGGELGVSTRAGILDRIPESGYRYRNRLTIPFAQAGVGERTAMSLTFTAASQGVIARDLAELMLFGYEDGRTDYAVGGTDGTAYGYWTFALGHGRTLGNGLDVGVTVRGISGTFLTRWQAFDPSISVEELEVQGQMIGAFAGDNFLRASLFDFRPPDGFGYSVDVGVARDRGPVRLGLAVQNLIHGMRWVDDIHLRTLSVRGTPDGTSLNVDESRFDPANGSVESRQVAERLRANARFPRRLRASATYEVDPRLVLSYGAIVALDSGELDRGWGRRLGAGAELRPAGPIRLQAGMAADLAGSHELSAGAEVDLARTRLGAALARTSEADGFRGMRVVVGFSRF